MRKNATLIVNLKWWCLSGYLTSVISVLTKSSQLHHSRAKSFKTWKESKGKVRKLFLEKAARKHTLQSQTLNISVNHTHSHTKSPIQSTKSKTKMERVMVHTVRGGSSLFWRLNRTCGRPCFPIFRIQSWSWNLIVRMLLNMIPLWPTWYFWKWRTSSN